LEKSSVFEKNSTYPYEINYIMDVSLIWDEMTDLGGTLPMAGAGVAEQ